MSPFDKAPHFTFTTKAQAEEFIKEIKKMIFKYDVVTVNDVLHLNKQQPSSIDGLHYGYCKRDIQKVKPVKVDGYWQIFLPIPGKMIQDVLTGHWSTEPADNVGGGL
jgi:hypothetical protein